MHTTRRVTACFSVALIRALAIATLSGASTANAQRLDLEDLKRQIDAGKPVKFRFAFNSIDRAESPATNGMYACCGMPAVYMARGSIVVTATSLAFDFSTAVSDFTVSPESVVAFASEPHMQSRVQVTVSQLNKKGKAKLKTYYLYNPAATGAGDPAVGGPGASIVCPGCDNSMEILSRLIAWLRTPNRQAPAPSIATTPEPGTSGMTNEDVVRMVSAGLSEQVITTAIHQEKRTAFDLSPTALIALKQAHVPDGVIALMQKRKPEAGAVAPAATPMPDDGAVNAGATASAVGSPCIGFEMMGLYKVDMQPVSPLVVYQAKVRNKTSAAGIVTIGWLDMYGTERQARGQVGAGDIATFDLGPQTPRDRQPLNLRVKACE